MPLLNDELRRNPTPAWLQQLEPQLPMPLPLRDLLNGSLYYPASEFDGWPVQHLGGLVHSFVYVDYGPTRSDLGIALRGDGVTPGGFAGYRLHGERDVQSAELAPESWRPEFVPKFTTEEAAEAIRSMADARASPFCRWLVFERIETRGSAHGPERFSLLYLRADGLAAYEPLYIRLRARPAGIALLRSDTAFAGNYTSFMDPSGHLHSVVMRNGRINGPDFMLAGWPGYQGERWPEFQQKLGEFQERAIWSRLLPSMPRRG